MISLLDQCYKLEAILFLFVIGNMKFIRSCQGRDLFETGIVEATKITSVLQSNNTVYMTSFFFYKKITVS